MPTADPHGEMEAHYAAGLARDVDIVDLLTVTANIAPEHPTTHLNPKCREMLRRAAQEIRDLRKSTT